jgi:hypothetical protein
VCLITFDKFLTNVKCMQWVVYRETIGLLPGKQLVVSRLG